MLSINGWCPFQNEQINALCGHELFGLCFSCCLSDSQSLRELTLLYTWLTDLVLRSSVRESEKLYKGGFKHTHTLLMERL